MSWLVPKQLEDASRILRGLALVVAAMASESNFARRAAISDYQRALQFAADLLAQQAASAQQAAATSTASQQQSPPSTAASQSTGHETPPSATPQGDSHTGPLTPSATPTPATSTTTTTGGHHSAGGPGAAAHGSVAEEFLRSARDAAAGAGGPSSQGTRPLGLDVARELTDAATKGVMGLVATASTSPLAPSFAAQGFAAQLRAAAAAAAAAAAEIEAVSAAGGVAERTGAQPSPPPPVPPPPPSQQQDPMRQLHLTDVAAAPSVAAGAATEDVRSPEALKQTASAAPGSDADRVCDPSSSATGGIPPEVEAAVAAGSSEARGELSLQEAATGSAGSGSGAADDDVPPPDARLPSVHDDMVVAAIASSQQQPVMGTGTVAEVGPAAAGAGGKGAESGPQEHTSSSSPSSSQSSRPTSVPLQAAPRKLRERRVPETPLGRALGFAGLGASLLVGSLADSVGRAVWGGGTEATGRVQEGGGAGGGGGSTFLTQANAERLANALCRMRGAALKIGQMLSIQDESVLPPQVQAALERVRSAADVMPRSQLEGVLATELGPSWRERLSDFEWEPRAAASIGQVHSAVLTDGRRVAMKIQYPGVARSIESDVDNLMRLIAVANILPRGMYAENAARVAKRELALECDYSHELMCQRRYRALLSAAPDLVAGFHVPEVVPELSSQRIITTEWVAGVPLDKVCELPQSVRDSVATRLLGLTLRELFEWRFMQTDPNWGNFLYDVENDKINLIDFGASRDYPESFVSDYLRMVAACADGDRQGVIDMSIKLGFLTGDESEVMLDAHTRAGFVVGMPFAAPGLYDFGSHGGMTSRVSELGGVMLKHRLTPPPQESYSLHRKLSGAFLACMKLKAKVACRDMFFRTYESILGPYMPPRLPSEGAKGTPQARPPHTPGT